MSPARRLQARNPDAEPEKEHRVRLTEDVREYLRISPFVLVPTLKTNRLLRKSEEKRKDKSKERIARKVKENDNSNSNDPTEKEVKKPLQNGQLYSLPVTRMSVVNGITQRIEKLKHKDIRDDDSKKGTFLSALNLVDTPTAERVAQRAKDAELAPSLYQKLRSRKGQVVTYFRNNPVPISSKLGKQIVIKSGIGKCSSPKDEVTRYEKWCSFFKQRNLNHTTTWPQVNIRKSKLKPDQYCHVYSYGKRQRVKRNVELVVGVSSKSFSSLNSCRDASVSVYRMTDSDVARAMFQIQSGQSVLGIKQPSSSTCVPQLRWMASEPCAGPSRGIEIIAEPVVKLYDIRLSPSKSEYFQ